LAGKVSSDEVIGGFSIDVIDIPTKCLSSIDVGGTAVMNGVERFSIALERLRDGNGLNHREHQDQHGERDELPPQRFAGTFPRCTQELLHDPGCCRWWGNSRS